MNIIQITNNIIICEEKTGINGYDFDFENNLPCKHPINVNGMSAILRCGAIPIIKNMNIIFHLLVLKCY